MDPLPLSEHSASPRAPRLSARIPADCDSSFARGSCFKALGQKTKLRYDCRLKAEHPNLSTADFLGVEKHHCVSHDITCVRS
eukprot:5179132-Prymnesium_polylepis.1